MHYTPLGAAALKALVVAKFLLIGDAIRRVAQRQSRRLPVRIVTRLVWLLVILILLTTLAYLINKKFRGNDLWTTVVVLPMLLSPAVVGNFWTFLYQPQIGLFNYVVGLFTGKDPASFSMIADVTLAPWAIVVVDTWMWTPFVMLICLAGLRSIPDSIYEAAECDRASKWRQFWTITIPMAAPFLMLAGLFRGIEDFGSSKESVGEFRLRKPAKHVIQGEFCDSERPVAVRFSQCDFGLVVQALDDAAGELLGLEVVEQQLPVSAHGAGEVFHRLDARTHRPDAPGVEVLGRPGR